MSLTTQASVSAVTTGGPATAGVTGGLVGTTAAQVGTGRAVNKFMWADYLVFAALIIASLGIGVYHAIRESRKKASTVEFLMGGKSMGILPISMSMVAAFMSALAILGTSGEIYLYGSQYMLIILCYPIFIFLCVTFYLPVFFQLDVTSAFEYLEIRFSRFVRLVAGGIFMIQMTLYMAMVLLQPCLAFETTTGFNKWAAVVSIGVACTLYTTMGGMKAVVWNDVLQVSLMYVAIVAVLVKGIVDAGGWSSMWKINEAGGRIEFLTWDPNPLVRHSIWGLLIGGTFMWLSIYGCNQAIIQKALSTRGLKHAKAAIWLNVPGMSSIIGLSALCGLTMYPAFRGCDPIMVKDVESHSQVMALYVMRFMNWPGFPGLFVAGVFSGSLSTLAAGINSLAAVTWKDYLNAFIFKDVSDHKAAIISKILAFTFGLAITALTYPISMMGGLLQAALGIFGLLGGPVLGVFTLGMFFPNANKHGALAALVLSLVISMYVGGGYYILKPNLAHKPLITTNCTNSWEQQLTPRPPRAELPWYQKVHELSYLYYGLLALVVALISGLSVTACTGWRKVHREDIRLMSPIIAKLWSGRINAQEEEERAQARARGTGETDEMLHMKNLGGQRTGRGSGIAA